MASLDPVQIGSDLLLVHEGTVDLHVIGQLVRHHKIQGFQFLQLDGQSKMRRFFKGLSALPHFKTPVPGYDHPVRALAIVLDAETDAASTFQRISNALIAANLPVPENAGSVAEGDLRVGIFLVPDNQAPGKIETLCLRSVKGDYASQCLDVFFDCILQRGGELPENMDKARAQAFLATRPQPGLPVGLAALENYWDFANDAFTPLVAFLRTMTNFALSGE